MWDKYAIVRARSPHKAILWQQRGYSVEKVEGTYITYTINKTKQQEKKKAKERKVCVKTSEKRCARREAAGYVREEDYLGGHEEREREK